MNNQTLITRINELLGNSDFQKNHSNSVTALEELKNSLLNADPFKGFAEITKNLYAYNPNHDGTKFDLLVESIRNAIEDSYKVGYNSGSGNSDTDATFKRGISKGYKAGKKESLNKGKTEGRKEGRKEGYKDWLNDFNFYAGIVALLILLAFSIAGSRSIGLKGFDTLTSLNEVEQLSNQLALSDSIFHTNLLSLEASDSSNYLLTMVADQLDKRSQTVVNINRNRYWSGVLLITLAVCLFIVSNLAFAMYFTRKKRQ